MERIAERIEKRIKVETDERFILEWDTFIKSEFEIKSNGTFNFVYKYETLNKRSFYEDYLVDYLNELNHSLTEYELFLISLTTLNNSLIVNFGIKKKMFNSRKPSSISAEFLSTIQTE